VLASAADFAGTVPRANEICGQTTPHRPPLLRIRRLQRWLGEFSVNGGESQIA